MPFLFKTLEKMVSLRVKETALVTHPLDDNQFGFIKGVSSDNALSKVIDIVESAYHKGQYAVALFLDIAGAFDNIKTQSVIDSFRAKHVEEEICGWYQHYLENRVAHGEVNSTSIKRYVSNGTPQGGTFSTDAYIIPADLGLQSARSLNTAADLVAYADDKAIIIRGPDPVMLVNITQQVLNKLVSWAESVGLQFSHEKSAAMIFTRKTGKINLPNLKIKHQDIKFVNQTRYLGLEIDKNLTWTPHIVSKLASAKRSLNLLRCTLGKNWGISPKMLASGYKSIIRPAITYGCICWGPSAVQKKTNLKKLKAVNRALVMSMGAFRTKAPTAGLEIILDIMPLDLHI